MGNPEHIRLYSMRTVPLVITDLKTPLKFEYTISDDGTVFNVSRGVPIKGTSISPTNRYRKVHLDKFRPLHRLVAEHFIPNPHGLPQVNHKDGDRLNNAASNLEWVSASCNVRHAYRTGLKTNLGEVNPIARLTEQDVRNIRTLAKQGLTARAIRDRLGLAVGVDCVKSVRLRKTWAHVV